MALNWNIRLARRSNSRSLNLGNDLASQSRYTSALDSAALKHCCQFRWQSQRLKEPLEVCHPDLESHATVSFKVWVLAYSSIISARPSGSDWRKLLEFSLR